VIGIADDVDFVWQKNVLVDIRHAVGIDDERWNFLQKKFSNTEHSLFYTRVNGPVDYVVCTNLKRLDSKKLILCSS
jgi:hypothetical protein